MKLMKQRQLNAERQRVRRANENNLDAQRRREHAAEHNRVNRVNEVPQQAAARRRVELVCHQARAPGMLNLARINAHCRALKFVNEKKFKCCCEGKVSLPDLLEFPEQIRNFLSSNSAQAKRFRKSIRLYNNAFAFASLGANIRQPPGNYE